MNGLTRIAQKGFKEAYERYRKHQRSSNGRDTGRESAGAWSRTIGSVLASRFGTSRVWCIHKSRRALRRKVMSTPKAELSGRGGQLTEVSFPANRLFEAAIFFGARLSVTILVADATADAPFCGTIAMLASITNESPPALQTIRCVRRGFERRRAGRDVVGHGMKNIPRAAPDIAMCSPGRVILRPASLLPCVSGLRE